jgi:hypothetical protein
MPARTSKEPAAKAGVMRSSWSQAETATVTSGMSTSWYEAALAVQRLRTKR